MTLNPNWFLNATGQFTPIGSGQIAISTTTTTGFMTYLASTATSQIPISSTATTFDFLSVSQGTSGVWYATGTVGFADGNATSQAFIKLWDGTSVIASGACRQNAANAATFLTLGGVIATPGGNIKMSGYCNSVNTVTEPNITGYGKDMGLTVIRIG